MGIPVSSRFCSAIGRSALGYRYFGYLYILDRFELSLGADSGNRALGDPAGHIQPLDNLPERGGLSPECRFWAEKDHECGTVARG